MKIDLDELERKARAALTEDRWRVHFCSDQTDGEACGICTGCDDDGRCDDRADIVGDQSYDECHHPMTIADAEHIAACDPPVVLALIARIRELETGLQEAIDGWDDCDRGRSAEDAALRRQVGDVLAKGVVLP